ncbi:MAG: hypothetical protein VB062_04640 [Christensenella sp.]|nr:hypothetical protein [Christensenella sp.]
MKNTKQTRVDAEYARISELLVDLDEKKREMIDGLIRRAAYLRIVLEDAEDDITKNGMVESFSQSDKAQPYERLRPVANIFSSTTKNYQAAMKQLIEALPEKTQKSAAEEIKKYIERR